MTAPLRHAAVLGHPVVHSLSPALHRAAYRQLGLDWDYQAVDVEPAGLSGFLDSLDSSWVGLSLTMPLKEKVLPLLTSVDAEAELLASVNTVLLGPGPTGVPSRHGANTDVTGLVALLVGASVPVGTEVTVLGGGATARSTLGALARRGAGPVTVCVRRAASGDALVRLGLTLGLDVRWRAFDDAAAPLGAPLVVATVPAGASDSLVSRVPHSAAGVLVDVLYQPWPTPLAAAWAAAGGVVVGGLELLVHQAAEQVRLMTGRDVPVGLLRQAGAEALAARGRPG